VIYDLMVDVVRTKHELLHSKLESVT